MYVLTILLSHKMIITKICAFLSEIFKEKMHEIVSSNMGSRVITEVEIYITPK